MTLKEGGNIYNNYNSCRFFVCSAGHWIMCVRYYLSVRALLSYNIMDKLLNNEVILFLLPNLMDSVDNVFSVTIQLANISNL